MSFNPTLSFQRGDFVPTPFSTGSFRRGAEPGPQDYYSSPRISRRQGSFRWGGSFRQSIRWAGSFFGYGSGADGFAKLREESGGRRRWVPEENASWFSHLMFNYCNELIKQGYLKPLDHDELWDVASRDEAAAVSARFQEAMHATADPVSAPQGVLWKAIRRVHLRLFAWTGCIKVVHDIIMFASPFLLERLLHHMAKGKDADRGTSLALSFAILVVAVLENFTVNIYFQLLYRMSLHLKIQLVDMLYDKSLRISSAVKSDMGVGAIVNLQSNDAAKLWNLPLYLHIMWNGPFQIFFVMGMLVRIMHWAPSMAGLGVTVVLIPLTAVLGKALGKSRREQIKFTDARVKLCAEIITGIKAIKLYAWERPYVERIMKLRDDELSHIKKTQALSMFNTAMYMSGPVLVGLAAFGTYSALGLSLTAAVAFPALALFNLLRFPLIMFPSQIMSLIQARVGLARIQKFMEAEEMSHSAPGYSHVLSPAPGAPSAAGSALSGACVSMHNGTFAWEAAGEAVLREVELEVKRGQLVIIVGQVGSGKSSLLSALLGEMHRKAGNVRVVGSVAYTAQDPWIQNATLRNNVLMGEEMDDEVYTAVLQACALVTDLELLPAGDASEIGEKGINLSGGQKHRVALARACYAAADIYLLDDPLSAVDAHVGRHLFDECVCGLLGAKTRLLVTHQLQYLSSADLVVVMDGGRVQHVGSYEGLVARGVDFHKFVKEEAQQEEQEGAEGGGKGGKESADDVAATKAKRDAAIARGRAAAEAVAQRKAVAAEKAAEEAQAARADAAAGANGIGKKSSLPALLTAVRHTTDSPGGSATPATGTDNTPYANGANGGAGGLKYNLLIPASNSVSSLGGMAGDATGGAAAADARAAPSGDGYTPDLPSKEWDRVPLLAASSSGPLTPGVLSPAVPASGEPSSVAPAMSWRANSLRLVSMGSARGGAGSGGSKVYQEERVKLLETMARKEKDGLLTKVEERSKGRVARSVYRAYLSVWSPAYLLPVGVVLFALSERGLQVLQNFTLSNWSNATLRAAAEHKASHNGMYLSLYFGLGLASILLGVVRSVALIYGSIRASRRLAKALLDKVVRLPMSFFDSQPTGRLLNRFTKDTESVDLAVSGAINSALTTFVTAALSVLVVAVVTPLAVVAFVPLSYIYYWVQQRYVASSRELKRLDSLAFSPIFQHFGESLSGLQTIRAFRKQEQFLERNRFNLNHSNRAYWPIQVVNRWLSVRLELMGAAVVFAACVTVAVVFPRNAGLAGLAITSALNLTSIMNWMVRQTTELEVNMNSVERMVEYNKQEEEAPEVIPSCRPPTNWPTRGAIQVKDLVVRYRPELDPVLKGISFEVGPGQKVGVCGRTGCGKSTLMMALYRLVEPCGGSIVIDGLNVATIGLCDLRSHLSLVPQDPVIFSGTVRSNLDPFSQAGGDAQVWEAIKRSGLEELVKGFESGLDQPIKEGGSNLSTGQRQLLCMARALLRASRILVLDEATSNVDHSTDALIQRTIRTAFRESTVLTIAHRLHTIIDSDRILLLDAGSVAEYGPPKQLLRSPDSGFRRLVEETTRGGGGAADDVAYALAEAVAIEDEEAAAGALRRSEDGVNGVGGAGEEATGPLGGALLEVDLVGDDAAERNADVLGDGGVEGEHVLTPRGRE